MEEKSKTEKLKLRGINQAMLISSSRSGAGTGPDDCMSQEVYEQLNDKGALNSTVYVCGIGWMTPDTIVYGSGSGFGSDSGSGSGFDEYGSGSGMYGSGSGSGQWGSGSGWSGGGGTGGGGTSGGGTSDGSKPEDEDKPGSKASVELMDKSKFVPWKDGANCLDLCKKTLRNYGITNYGNSFNVFRLTIRHMEH